MKYLFLIFMFSVHLQAASRFVVISDMNGSYGSKTYHSSVGVAINRIGELRPDLVISTGDMIAGQKTGLDYKGMWHAFHKKVTIPLNQLGIPLAVTPGNHDGSGSVAFKLERQEFVRQWLSYTPNLTFVDKTNYPSYYAFEMKGVLLISLDATLVGKLPLKQLSWLKDILEKNKHYRHKIVFGHLPLFPLSEIKKTEFMNDPELLTLLKTFKIDLFLSGHHHAYYPGVHKGVRQIGQGCLGAGPRKLIGSSEVESRSFTVIEISDEGHVNVEAYGGVELSEKIERATLPSEINYQKIKMIRDDLGNNQI